MRSLSLPQNPFLSYGLRLLVPYLLVKRDRLPISLRPRLIARELGYRENHFVETALGHALRFMESLGLVEKTSNKPARYRPTLALKGRLERGLLGFCDIDPLLCRVIDNGSYTKG